MSFEQPGGKSDLFGDTLLNRGGGQRLKRGFLKYAILELLAEQPHHGYQIIKELEQRFAGVYRPSAGSVYPSLQVLEEEGSLSIQEVESRKICTITEHGRKQLAQHRQHFPPEPEKERQVPIPVPVPLLSNPATDSSHIPEIKRSTIALMETIRYVAHLGTPEQVRELKKILDATSRQLHALLAMEEGEISPPT